MNPTLFSFFKYGWLLLLLAGLLSACNTATDDDPLPTLARVNTATVPPTITESPIPASATPSPTITDTATPTITPIPSETPVPSATATSTFAPAPVFPTVPLPFSPTPNPQQVAQSANSDQALSELPAAFRFGQSVNGADLLAYRHGSGSQVIMLVGGIHMGYEAVTVDLVRELREFFRDRPQEILPGITLIFVPALNPDGRQYGEQLRGRFNANNVDLNRNWGCGWSPDAVFQDRDVNPGSEPFSEPETRALGSLIQRIQPDAVMFYHAAANGVYSGSCNPGSTVSDALAEIYGTAARYPFESDFNSYVVTGSAPAWVDSLGIPALDVELASSETPEFQRNLNGLMAVQRWLTRTTD